MLLSNLVVAASFLIAAFNAIAAIPHIRERHIIRIPLKFKIIHHHKIHKVPVYIRKHIHHYKEKHPVVEDTQSNHIFHEDGHEHLGDHLDFHQEEEHPPLKSSSIIPYNHHTYRDTQEHDYDEQEQSQEDEYEDDEYE